MNLAELVSRHARERPDTEALVGTSTRCTWSEYDDAIARVAARLLRAGLVPGDRVAVAQAKDAASFVVIHAVLRVGGVVVPIDPLAPPLSARAVLEDAEVAALFAERNAIAAIDPWSSPSTEVRLVVSPTPTDDPRVTPWADLMAGPRATECVIVGDDDPAYIIYTSGSTGRPKGIVHTHRSALAYATRAVVHHELTDTDRLAGMSPLHFDMSTLELYAAPLAGAAVVVFGEGHLRFPASFTARCEAERTTVWYTVPTFLRQVVERGAVQQRDLSSLRLVMYAGESYSSGAVRELMQALPGRQVKNVYGPAEVNECTNHRVTDADLDGDIPIGRPWDGVDLLVVDDEGRPVGTGQQGELWVSAPTLMAGYWRRPELTERSVSPRDDGPSWYATGDLVSVDHDGVYRFAGRRDHQVKVRGVRLELEAVEVVLDDAPGVAHAVAVPVGPRGEVGHVAAVVVPRDGAVLDEEAIRAHCRARLPAIAVPREIIWCAELPSTPTGKIDRRRVRQEYASPRSDRGARVEAVDG